MEASQLSGSIDVLSDGTIADAAVNGLYLDIHVASNNAVIVNVRLSHMIISSSPAFRRILVSLAIYVSL